jgi:hypothetical protein
MTDIEIPGITEKLPELEPTVIIAILIIILIWAILWFFVPFWVFGIWRRMKKIEGLIRQQVEGSRPHNFHARREKRPLSKAEKKHEGKQEIDEETKKILDEMGYRKKDQDDTED